VSGAIWLGKKRWSSSILYYDWPAYHNARSTSKWILDLRPSACVVPLTKRRALRFNDILMETEVSTPPINRA